MAVKKLGNGRWEASYRDPAGKERIKRHRTRAEADRWLASVKADLQRGEYVEPGLARTRSRSGPISGCRRLSTSSSRRKSTTRLLSATTCCQRLRHGRSRPSSKSTFAGSSRR